MSDDVKTHGLTPANENPWYVLMTLYGEQDGERVDENLAKKNREFWNAWVCQGMTEEERKKCSEDLGIASKEMDWSYGFAHELAEKRRTDKRFPIGFDPFSISTKFADFRNTEFSQCFDLEGFILEKANFSYSRFLGSVKFDRVIALHDVRFDASFFGSIFHSTDARFKKDASFRLCEFTREVFFARNVLESDAHFIGSRFRHDANFSHNQFDGKAQFDGSNFAGAVSFAASKFLGFASFNGSEFNKRPDFVTATFRSTAMFARVNFRLGAHFVGAKFWPMPNNLNCSVVFRQSQFQGPTSFEDCLFRQNWPDLVGASFFDETTLSVNAGSWPQKRKRLLGKVAAWLKFDARERHDMQPHAEAKASAAKLRHILAKQALPEEEHFFFRHEMHHAARAEPIWKTAHIYFFEAVSDFGHSIARPANLLLALWLLGAFIYYEAATFGPFEALGYSFANMFKFFGLQRTYFDYEVIRLWPGWLQWVSGTQTVLAFILLFFLGLGLRTRFRLR